MMMTNRYTTALAIWYPYSPPWKPPRKITRAMDSVDVPGPPAVRATIWSKTCRNHLNDSTMLMVKNAPISGKVIERNCRQRDAPSMAAAS